MIFQFAIFPGDILVGDLLGILKIFILLGLFLYLFFAVLVVRHAKLMTQTVQGELDRLIKIISWAHFAFAACVLVLSFVIL
jgi:hypothetical protein